MYYCDNSLATKGRYDRYMAGPRCYRSPVQPLCRAQLEHSRKLVDKRLEVVFRAHGQGRQADAKRRCELAAIT